MNESTNPIERTTQLLICIALAITKQVVDDLKHKTDKIEFGALEDLVNAKVS